MSQSEIPKVPSPHIPAVDRIWTPYAYIADGVLHLGEVDMIRIRHTVKRRPPP